MNCIITGSTKGIGRATAEIFAQHGFNLALIASNTKHLETFQQTLESSYPDIQVLAFPTDLSVKNQVSRLAELIKTHWNQVDVLMNNVGIFIQSSMLTEEEGLLERLMNINLYAAFHLTRAIAPMMIKQGHGHIFNMGSVASLKAFPDSGSYTITKFAMLGFSRSLRLELLDKGVKVTTILPGSTLTASWADTELPPERLIDPTEIAKAIYNAWDTGPSVCIEEILMRPQLGDL